MQQWKANTTKVLANLKKNVQIWKLNQFTCSSTNPSFCISNISHVTLYAIFQRLQLEYSLFLYLTALSHQRTVFSFFSPVFNPLPTQAFSVVFPLPQHDSFLSTCLRQPSGSALPPPPNLFSASFHFLRLQAPKSFEFQCAEPLC